VLLRFIDQIIRHEKLRKPEEAWLKGLVATTVEQLLAWREQRQQQTEDLSEE
jgi:response regulator of citrate/malate metabolism